MHYKTDLLNLSCEDNMALMARYPDKYFELAIVDPPYGIGLGFSKNKKVKNGTMTKGHEQKNWNNNIPKKKYFDELHRISKNQIIWGANYYWNFIEAKGAIIHDKMVTPFIASTYSHADIASCSLQNRITIFKHQWSGNVQNGRMNTKNENDLDLGIENRIHPTQKPIALYKWLLKNYAKPGDKIIDTHLGSGSIAIACHYAGYHLTACEIDQDYFKKAIDRIQQQTAQISLSLQ